jgi:hypothetical protein
MRVPQPSEPPHSLLPEGRRWGFGAHSILPYLTRALQARPGTAEDPLASIRNPVFEAMDEALRTLRQRH